MYMHPFHNVAGSLNLSEISLVTNFLNQRSVKIDDLFEECQVVI